MGQRSFNNPAKMPWVINQGKKRLSRSEMQANLRAFAARWREILDKSDVVQANQPAGLLPLWSSRSRRIGWRFVGAQGRRTHRWPHLAAEAVLPHTTAAEMWGIGDFVVGTGHISRCGRDTAAGSRTSGFTAPIWGRMTGCFTRFWACQ